MRIFAGVFLGVLAQMGIAAADMPDVEPIDPVDEPEEQLIFRWYDTRGMAHDTSDASVIPPGSKFEVKGGLHKQENLQRRRSWWRARKSRIEAELRGAQDELKRAKSDLKAAIEEDVPGAKQAALATRVETWKSIVATRQRELRELKDKAKKAKVPPRWLND